ncbi:MAG: thymidylate synthase [Bdellovibrionota bacterium]
MTYKQFIEEPNLSTAWAASLKSAYAEGKQDVVPLVVSITGFDDSGKVIEDPSIRAALDQYLAATGDQTVETVANTIFPISMWNRNAPRAQLFERYSRMFSRLQAASTKNRHGVYFQRMIEGGRASNPNQLDYIIDAYSSKDGVRRSLLQVAIFNPSLDHSTTGPRGFPCLQHITFSPSGDELSVNAFYAFQYMVEKAYGNYLGLCRLGQFVAHELDLKLTRVTCYSGISKPDANVGDVQPMLDAYERVLAETQGAE